MTIPTRHDLRREVKLKLAELMTAAERKNALIDHKRTLIKQQDEAIEAAEAESKPLQDELADIETDVATTICAGKPVTNRLARRRGEILSELALISTKRDATIDAIKKLVEVNNKQQRELDSSLAELPRVRNRLADLDLASPHLLVQRHVATQGRLWAMKRRDSARDGLSRAEDAIRVRQKQADEYRGINSRGEVYRELPIDSFDQRLENDVAYCRAEYEAAEAAYAAAEAELQKARAAVYDE